MSLKIFKNYIVIGVESHKKVCYVSTELTHKFITCIKGCKHKIDRYSSMISVDRV